MDCASITRVRTSVDDPGGCPGDVDKGNPLIASTYANSRRAHNISHKTPFFFVEELAKTFSVKIIKVTGN